MLALRHPDLFGAAAGMSSSLYFAHAGHPRGEAFQTELANALPAGEYDCFALAPRVDPGQRPALHFSIGRSDGHFAVNRAFHRLLDRLHWPHFYAEHPGSHDRDFWTARLPGMLEFFRALDG